MAEKEKNGQQITVGRNIKSSKLLNQAQPKFHIGSTKEAYHITMKGQMIKNTLNPKYL